MPLCAMRFLGPRAVPVFVTVLLLMAVASSGVMSALLPCANSLSSNPFSCDGVIVFELKGGGRYSVGMWAGPYVTFLAFFQLNCTSKPVAAGCPRFRLSPIVAGCLPLPAVAASRPTRTY